MDSKTLRQPHLLVIDYFLSYIRASKDHHWSKYSGFTMTTSAIKCPHIGTVMSGQCKPQSDCLSCSSPIVAYPIIHSACIPGCFNGLELFSFWAATANTSGVPIFRTSTVIHNTFYLKQIYYHFYSKTISLFYKTLGQKQVQQWQLIAIQCSHLDPHTW